MMRRAVAVAAQTRQWMHALAALSVVAAVAVSAAAQSVPVDPPARAPEAQKRNLYERIVVIGASASDGFGVFIDPAEPSAAKDAAAMPANADTQKPRRAPPVSTSLAAILRQAGAPSTPPASNAGATTAVPTLPTIRHFTSGFFFANPGPVARSEVDRAIDAQPSLVLALDYLFWFAYGTVNAEGEPMRDGAQRLENLERGLQQLQRIIDAGAPIVLGDIPDMRESIGRMLSKAQVPSVETIDQSNERIRAWVRERPSTRLLPLSQIQAGLRGRKPVNLGGREWVSTDEVPLLQRNQLHPTFVGTVAIASALIDTARAFDADAPVPFRFDPSEIRSKILVAKAEGKGEAAHATPPISPIKESSPSTP
jgi:hypothetical protein